MGKLTDNLKLAWEILVFLAGLGWAILVCLMGVFGITLILSAFLAEFNAMPSDVAAAISFQGKLFMFFATGVWLVWLSSRLITSFTSDQADEEPETADAEEKPSA